MNCGKILSFSSCTISKLRTESLRKRISGAMSVTISPWLKDAGSIWTSTPPRENELLASDLAKAS
jgi:hypothetical protein